MSNLGAHIRGKTVLVRRIFIESERARLNEYFKLLDPLEQTSAENKQDRQSRENFIVVRAQAKSLCAETLGIEVSKIRFDYTKNGKPILNPNPDALHFNLSHSEGHGVIALAYERRVGIDIDTFLPGFDFLSVARRFFHQNDIKKLQSLPQPEQLELFGVLWTQKEAQLKAEGRRIADGALALDKSAQNHEIWQLERLKVLDPRMFCHLAIEGSAPFEISYI